MKADSTAPNFESAILARVSSAIENKKVENTEIVGTLTKLQKALPDINKEIDEKIKARLSNLDLDSLALKRTISLLDRNDCAPEIENIFPIAGKVIDSESGSILPGLRVRLLGRESTLIAEDETNSLGNFNFHFSREELEEVSKQAPFSFNVYAKDKLIHTQEYAMKASINKIDEVILKVKCGADNANIVKQGKAVIDTIEFEAELFQLKAAKMEATAERLPILNELSLRFSKELKKMLSGKLPEITAESSSEKTPAKKKSSKPRADKEWVVSGTVTNEEGKGLAGLLVKAYDRDVKYDDLLGAVTTNAKGHYKIVYKTQDFSEAEAAPDLFVEVYDMQQRQLFSTRNNTRYDAGDDETIDITISNLQL